MTLGSLFMTLNSLNNIYNRIYIDYELSNNIQSNY